MVNVRILSDEGEAWKQQQNVTRQRMSCGPRMNKNTKIATKENLSEEVMKKLKLWSREVRPGHSLDLQKHWYTVITWLPRVNENESRIDAGGWIVEEIGWRYRAAVRWLSYKRSASLEIAS